MAEFKLGRIRFVWKNDWTTGTAYYKDDIVAYGGKTYLCVTGHTAAADFYTDLDNVPSRWNQFSDGQDWKGNWANATLYKVNDIVKYGGYIYICNDGHTSQATLELDQSKWDVFAESFDWKGSWTTAVVYKVNDLVKYGGYVYLCNTAHTSAATAALGLENDSIKWDVFSKGIDWKGAWATSTRYKAGDLVKYGGTTYVCNTHHTSTATAASGLEADQAKWDYFNQGIEYKGVWVATTRYKVNDVVKNGGGTFICVTNHTAAANFVTDNAYWNQFVEGIEFEGDWNGSSITYQPGDLVRYGGNSYISKTAHVSSAGSPPVTNTTNWDLFTTGFRLMGDWNSSTAYKIGEVVRLRGFTYVATANSTNQTPPNASYWSLLNQGIDWEGTWTSARSYVLGDAVKYGSNSYLCILAHTSSNGVDRPDNDGTGTYWNLLAGGNEESVLTTTGDLVYYGGAGPTRLPVGDEGQVLTVENGLPAWNYFGRVAKVFYVGPHGVDQPAPTYGLTIDQPWASVKYATEQIEQGTEYRSAAYLLKQNRTFVQKEIVEWVDYQISTSTAPFTGAFSYNKTKCQRDMGLLIDAIVYDLTHLGNQKSIDVAQSYFTALGASYIAGQEDETVAAINYGASLLINSVLANTAPAANYQALNGIAVGDRIKQIIDATYTAEAGADDRVQELAAIVTDAITAGDLDDLPREDIPGYTLNIKTGQFYEVLPIIAPANTAFVGDELRGTRISPEGSLIAANDKAKSVAVLQHLKSITDNIVTNAAVTPTTGNSETQDTTSQNEGNTGSTTAVTSVENNVDEIKDILANGEGAADAFVTPNPTGYNTSYLIGYGDARTQLESNRAFLKAEITAFVTSTYTTTVTASDETTDEFLCTATAWMYVGQPVRFTGTVIGGVSTGTTYYVNEVVDGTHFKISTTTDGDAVELLTASGSMTVSFYYNTVTCERDVGLIIDAIKYDLTYDGNYQTRVAADAYFSYGESTLGSGETTVTLAAYARLKIVVGQVILETAVTPSTGNAVSQNTAGTAGSAGSATFAQARVQDIIDTITNAGTLPALSAPGTGWVNATLLDARTRLNSARSEIQSHAVNYIKREYPTLVFNETTCSRDVGYIVDALGYDLMFGANFASIKAGLAYRRGTSSAQLVIANQLAATDDILDFIRAKTRKIVAAGAVVTADIIWDDIIAYVNTGTQPIITGTNSPTEDLNIINAGKILELNEDFLAAEATAYADNTFKSTVTASTGSTTDQFTCGSQTWMVAGDTVRFSGTVFGGISTNTTYYILASGLTSTTFKVSLTSGGTAVDLSTAAGSMTVRWYYSSTRCQNDVRNYVRAISYDLIYTGNYKSTLAARYYRNALTGSKLENMFLVRNGCGVRNMTVTGLDGSSDGNTTGYHADGLLPANEFGTRRPRAGAYVSLDPGWGPNDTRAWVTNKSTYVQNVTTFGIGATGQKIDGSLHAGGNDSIVSNDFTQVISDGIGAWVTNLGRAELVSVFSYYAHIAYLAENGGKIRATNGNNSYGTFGSVAEGVDVTETAITGKINNQNSEADIRNVLVDGDQILALEYGNAGSAYSSATYTISGAGASAATRGDEIRDGAVFQVRLTDPGDSSGPGGTGYITAGNVAQAGNTTQITIAAADTNSSAAYVGMSIYLTAGTGAGQYGYIGTYNAGSKVATVFKESDGTAGWDHIVAGTAIEAALDVTTGYQITPRLSFSSPGFTKTRASLPASRDWSDIIYGDGYAAYTGLFATGGSGSLSTFNVTRRRGVYTVTPLAGGVSYVLGNTLTILGTAVGGTTPANDITITVTQVGNTGAIQAVTITGDAVSPKYVAIAKSTNQGAWSLDGVSWNAMTMPGSQEWTAIAYGAANNISYFVAVARNSSAAAWSRDGVNWTSTTLGEVADWCDVAYGNGTFVAVSESDSSTTFRSLSSNGGQTWTSGTIASGAKAIAYGGTRFVVVEGNFSNSVAYSTTGSSWTVATLPANDDSSESNWVDIAYGNNRFVAIADNAAMAAYSFDGITWIKSTLPAIAEWNALNYGQGVFYATAIGDIAATSYDGKNWTLRDNTYAYIDITNTAEDTNAGYVARTLPNSGYWTDVIWTGSKFVAVGHDNSSAPYGASSANGETWSAVTLPTVSGTYTYSAIAYNGTNRYVAVIQDSRNIAYSTDGVSWTSFSNAFTSPLATWTDVVYGDKWVCISGSSARVQYASDPTAAWSNATIAGGSTENSAIAYGLVGATYRYVIVTGYTSGSQIASHSTDGITWTSAASMPSSDVWSSIAYGNGKFVAVAGNTTTTTTKAAYSTNGTSWTAATMPGAAARWVKVVYGGNAFTAFAYNSTRTAYSEDGITWVEGPALTATANWNTAAYGNERLVALATGGTTTASSNNFELNSNLMTTTSGTADLNVNDIIVFDRDSTGAEIFGGVRFEDTKYYITSIKNSTQFTISTTKGGANRTLTSGSGSMLARTGKEYVASAIGNYLGDPKWIVLGKDSQGVLAVRQGCKTIARSYVSNGQIAEIWITEPGSGYTEAPTMTITDPNNTGPDATFTVRLGNGALGQPTFTNRGANYSAASAIVTGDGYADNYQVSGFVGFKELTDLPIAGSNVSIAGIDDVYYKLVNVTNIAGVAGNYTATLQLSPVINSLEAPEHESVATIRRRFSQVRLTGHDFLDIGTGDFTNTNYPGLPLTDPIPANETVQSSGGRVFYTSTDQDGNFRVGGLFNVEQSTGVATLNADAFNVAGLNELSLGSVALGGSGATISEFSTDPFFTQDSDSVIPTQRAIKAYITSQIGGGGSSLNVNTLTAGVIYIAGQSISTTTNVEININTKVNFKGGIVGDALVLNYFLLNN